MYDEAIAQYEHLIELLPERKMIYEERIALTYENAGAYDEARVQYENLIQAYPHRAQIYSERIEKLPTE